MDAGRRDAKPKPRSWPPRPPRDDQAGVRGGAVPDRRTAATSRSARRAVAGGGELLPATGESGLVAAGSGEVLWCPRLPAHPRAVVGDRPGATLAGRPPPPIPVVHRSRPVLPDPEGGVPGAGRRAQAVGGLPIGETQGPPYRVPD